VTDDTQTMTEDTGTPDPAAALAAERDDLKDRLLRMTAEFDNYRKRVDRERRELSEAAAADLIRDLLPAIDDLERAMAAAANDPGAAPLLRGVELTHRRLLDELRKRGVEPIDAVGTPFDPQLHESVAAEPADGRADGEVIEEFRRGYRAGGRLIRPAMVKVAKA
jgi:molecular chaperone GrpE